MRNWNWRWIAGTTLYVIATFTWLTILLRYICNQNPWLPGVIFGTVFGTLISCVVPLVLERRREKRRIAYYTRLLEQSIKRAKDE